MGAAVAVAALCLALCCSCCCRCPCCSCAMAHSSSHHSSASALLLGCGCLLGAVLVRPAVVLTTQQASGPNPGHTAMREHSLCQHGQTCSRQDQLHNHH